MDGRGARPLRWRSVLVISDPDTRFTLPVVCNTMYRQSSQAHNRKNIFFEWQNSDMLQIVPKYMYFVCFALCNSTIYCMLDLPFEIFTRQLFCLVSHFVFIALRSDPWLCLDKVCVCWGAELVHLLYVKWKIVNILNWTWCSILCAISWLTLYRGHFLPVPVWSGVRGLEWKTLLVLPFVLFVILNRTLKIITIYLSAATNETKWIKRQTKATCSRAIPTFLILVPVAD